MQPWLDRGIQGLMSLSKYSVYYNAQKGQWRVQNLAKKKNLSAFVMSSRKTECLNLLQFILVQFGFQSCT